MKTKQLVLHSAVTIVATGLTLLSSSTSEASGRGLSGVRMSGGRGAMSHMNIHQGISNRGQRTAAMNRMKRRDDRGGHGRDDGIRHDASVNRGEREHERHHGRDDRKGHDSSVTRGEREREHRHGRDDRKGHDSSVNRGEREGERRHGNDDGRRHDRGDDHGRHHEPGDR